MYHYYEDMVEFKNNLIKEKEMNNFSPLVIDKVKELAIENRLNGFDDNYTSCVNIIVQPDIFTEDDYDSLDKSNMDILKNITVLDDESDDFERSSAITTLNKVKEELVILGMDFFSTSYYAMQINITADSYEELNNLLHKICERMDVIDNVDVQIQLTVPGNNQSLFTNFFATTFYLSQDIFSTGVFHLSTNEHLIDVVAMSLIFDYMSVQVKKISESEKRGLLKELMQLGIQTNMESLNEIISAEVILDD